jgi:outer membrane protein assembly factor BamE
MRNIAVTLIILTIAAQVGCARKERDDIYRNSMLSSLPFVYKMPVQQGNIVTRDMVDQLQPGMNKAQVRYLLGTPMLTDIFHSNRWDYTYTMRRGHQQMEKRPLTLFFQDDALIRIQGLPLKGEPPGDIEYPIEEELIVKVPDWEKKTGLFGRALDAVGVERER